MDSLYLIIPVALVFLVVAIKLFFWAINNGQYDDLDTEAERILFDDDSVQKRKVTTLHSSQNLEAKITSSDKQNK